MPWILKKKILLEHQKIKNIEKAGQLIQFTKDKGKKKQMKVKGPTFEI